MAAAACNPRWRSLHPTAKQRTAVPQLSPRRAPVQLPPHQPLLAMRGRHVRQRLAGVVRLLRQLHLRAALLTLSSGLRLRCRLSFSLSLLTLSLDCDAGARRPYLSTDSGARRAGGSSGSSAVVQLHMSVQ